MSCTSFDHAAFYFFQRVTSGHIGLLVCGAFQASIGSDKVSSPLCNMREKCLNPLGQVGAKYRFSSSKGRWVNRENKKVIIKEGVDVWFKVCGVRQKSGAVHIDGGCGYCRLSVALIWLFT